MRLGRCIGAGAFSKVYEGVLRQTVPVAIKALKGSPDLLVFLKKELEVLKYVHCRLQGVRAIECGLPPLPRVIPAPARVDE